MTKSKLDSATKGAWGTAFNIVSTYMIKGMKSKKQGASYHDSDDEGKRCRVM